MKYLGALLLILYSGLAASQMPATGQVIPRLVIDSPGELLLAGEEYNYRPWSSEAFPDKLHVLQYVPGTRRDGKIFEPFTDLLQAELEPDSYHVTTIVNLDAALWGTRGLVASEVKSSKRRYPGATLVLDEDGSGATTWQLGDRGIGLMIVDERGIVRYFTREPMSETDMNTELQWLRAQIPR